MAHGHPSIRAGGAEQHAYELFQGVRRHGEFEPFLLARTGENEHRPVPGTLFRALGDDPQQLLLYTEGMDYFLHSQRDKTIFTIHLRDFLRGQKPDVVHFQHTLHIGIDAIRLVRNTLPNAAILVTLHEYCYICAADGQMLETQTNRPCTGATPERCHRCLPQFTATDFFLRERFIKSHLALVDGFIAPSRFLAGRFVDWGLPQEKITLIEYGRSPRDPLPARTLSNGQRRNRFGYFGQLSPYKGILVLLQAMSKLERNGGGMRLYINGANLDFQTADFVRRYQELVQQGNGSVRDLGSYSHAEINERMALVDWVVVPSVWWENSPLVIQEAFLHGRPVICSDIGGMKEKVTNDVDGLHFRVGDVDSLSETLHRAANSASLWSRLREGISPVFSAEESVAAHEREYRAALERKRGNGNGHSPHGGQ